MVEPLKQGERTVEALKGRLEQTNAELKRACETGDLPYTPRVLKLDEIIRDQYFAPGTTFILAADIRITELGGIEIRAVEFHSVVPGTVIDPVP